MWQVVRIGQGYERPLLNCAPFEWFDHAEEFAFWLTNSNTTRESPLRLAIRRVMTGR
jgi:hypothetical protein